MAKHNLNFRSSDVEKLFRTAVEKVNSDQWKSACEHVKEIKEFYWVKDGLFDEALDKFIISLEDSDSDEHEDRESEDETNTEPSTSLTATAFCSFTDGICPLPPSP